ncbi:MAG: alpha/beta hydrolase [Ornithinimicrobium sp.]
MTQLTVTSRGTDLSLEVYDSGGDGRAVVLIHGWPLNHESWSDQMSELERLGYRVVAYDRRGFGASDKPADGYEYDTLSDDLAGVLEALDLSDVTLVGFSMGGGEVARYISRHGQDRLHSVVFASAVPPYMLQTDDNPEGAIDRASVDEMKDGLKGGREEFFKEFTTSFFTAGEEVKVTDEQLETARAQCAQADDTAAVECIEAFAATDFREDLRAVTVPTLVLHGSADGTVPFENSGMRTGEAIEGARVHVIDDAPHGVNASHAREFNRALVAFLEEE